MKSLSLQSLLNPQVTSDPLATAGMSEREAGNKGKLFAACAELLLASGCAPDAKASVVFVPGRIEVLGKHTDYCGGRSLLCTVERGMCFVAVERADAEIRFHALDLKADASMALHPELQPAPRHWSNYPMTVVRRLTRNFPGIKTGADIAMSSDLPQASGLSSSSALIVGCFKILADLNRLAQHTDYIQNIRSIYDLAEYLGCIENGQSFRELAGDKGVGTFGGSQDHTAILCCKPGMLSLFSFCPLKHERDIPFSPGMRFVVAGSGVVAEKTRDAMEKYNRVSQRARLLVSRLNESTGSKYNYLREIAVGNPNALGHLWRLLNSDSDELDLKGRLQQFLTESEQLIPAAADAFEQQDWTALHDLVQTSQGGAESGLKNQILETIHLQRQLLEQGAKAASAFGAGFGGSVWGLFALDDIGRFQALQKSNPVNWFSTAPSCPAVQISSTSAGLSDPGI